MSQDGRGAACGLAPVETLMRRSRKVSEGVVCGACEKVKYGWVGEGAELGKDSMSYL